MYDKRKILIAVSSQNEAKELCREMENEMQEWLMTVLPQ